MTMIDERRARREELPEDVVLAFAPLHKRAFGMANGLALGLGVAVVTLISIAFPGEHGGYVALLGEYFAGYSVSWSGVFVGFAWGCFVGFVAGWFVAFMRNLSLAVSLWIGRTREELGTTRDFLDHI